jgi:hypothetical protein
MMSYNQTFYSDAAAQQSYDQFYGNTLLLQRQQEYQHQHQQHYFFPSDNNLLIDQTDQFFDEPPKKESRGRGRPPGSRNTSKKEKSTKKSVISQDFLKIEQRKDLAVIIFKSRRLVMNCKKADLRVCHGMDKIKFKSDPKLAVSPNDAQLFVQRAELPMITLNEEKLTFVNIENNLSVESDIIHFEDALKNELFQTVNRLPNQLGSVQVLKDGIPLTEIYDTNINSKVINHDKAKSVFMYRRADRKEQVIFNQSPRQVNAHKLLKRIPLHLTVDNVYENMDFDSFVIDFKEINENVNNVNQQYAQQVNELPIHTKIAASVADNNRLNTESQSQSQPYSIESVHQVDRESFIHPDLMQYAEIFLNGGQDQYLANYNLLESNHFNELEYQHYYNTIEEEQQQQQRQQQHGEPVSNFENEERSDKEYNSDSSSQIFDNFQITTYNPNADEVLLPIDYQN